MKRIVDIEKINQMFKKNFKVKEIAEEMKISECTVRRYKKL